MKGFEMKHDPRTIRRDGFGIYDSLGDRAIRFEIIEIEDAENMRASRHLAAWKKRKGI
jgi:hypothetical protein